jgi:hypothetical protein
MTSRGLSEALRARGLSKRKPTEHDRPRPQPPPGPKIRPLPGQLSLDDASVGDERPAQGAGSALPYARGSAATAGSSTGRPRPAQEDLS